MANKSEGEVRAALVAALIDNPRQLGEVYKLDPDMNLKAKNIAELEGAANESAGGGKSSANIPARRPGNSPYILLKIA